MLFNKTKPAAFKCTHIYEFLGLPHKLCAYVCVGVKICMCVRKRKNCVNKKKKMFNESEIKGAF